MRNAAAGLRLPTRVCRIHSRPLLDGELHVAQVPVVPLQRGQVAEQLAVQRRVRGAELAEVHRAAAAVDDVLALGVDEVVAVGPGSPVAGLRVKQTPLPERRPRLPNTICTILTAVPRSSAMPSCAR